MTNSRVVAGALALALAACGSGEGSDADTRAVEPELEAWAAFVRTLQAGSYPAADVRPYYEDLRQPMVGFLDVMREKANWEEWRRPKVLREEDEVHYLLPLTFDGETATYCFSFLREGDRWHFEHLEAITLMLDSLGPLPVRSFPDLEEEQKAWIREEIEISQEVRMFNTLAAQRGVSAALEWFKDGAGYALAARAWIPYVSPSRALILYACWEQARLRGNEVVLERLEDDSAVIRIRPRYFQLYEQAAHLRQQIPPELYRQLYETRWQDRAAAAGWDLILSCEAGDCTFRFGRISP